MLDVLLNDTDAIAVRAADGPELALGFPNGAGMASMMGCFDSTDIYAAHVAVHIDEGATFDATCAGDLVNGDKRKLQQRELNPNFERVWMATGETDFFIDTVGVDGLLAQFDTWCTDTPTELGECTSTDCTTFDCRDCAHPEGELCVYYDGFGHEMAPGMTYNAWNYLTAATHSECTGSCPPSDGGGGDKPGACELEAGEECSKNGAEYCKDGLRCHRGSCKA